MARIRPWVLLVVIALVVGAYFVFRPADHKPSPAPSRAEVPKPPEPAKLTPQVSETGPAPAEAQPAVLKAAALSGVIRDHEGKPVAEADVLLLLGEGKGARLQTAQTDSEGHFAFEATLDGSWSIFVKRSPGLPAWHLISVDPLSGETPKLDALELKIEEQPVKWSAVVKNTDGEPVVGTAVSLVLMQVPDVESEEVRKQLAIASTTGDDGLVAVGGMQPASYEVRARKPGYALWHAWDVECDKAPQKAPMSIVLERGMAVAGRVIGPEGKPVEGARVACYPVEYDDVDQDVALATATSGAGGAFSLADVPAGMAVLVASAKGRANGYLAGLKVRPGTPVSECTITLDRATTISGVVVDKQDRPLPGASVTLGRSLRLPSSTRYDECVFRVDTATAGADGTFRFENAPAADAQVWATLEGFGYESVSVEKEGPVRLVLTELPAVTGVVTLAETGKPVEKAIVYCISARQKAETDAEGRYTIRGLSVGTSGFIAGKAGLATPTIARVSVKSGRTVELNLTVAPCRVVSGVVVEAGTGAPLAEAQIMGWPEDENRGYYRRYFSEESPCHALTDDAGAFTIPLLSPKVTELIVRADDHVPAHVELKTATLPLRVELSRGASVSGRVLGPGGEPLNEAEVTLEKQDEEEGQDKDLWAPQKRFRALLRGVPSETPGPGQTGEDGTFQICGLGPGTYTISAEHEKYVQASLDPIELAQDQALDNVVIQLGEGGFIAGIVRDEKGTPVEEVEVRFSVQQDEEPSRQNASLRRAFSRRRFAARYKHAMDDYSPGGAATGMDGAYLSPPIKPGRYLVSVRFEGYICTQEESVLVTPGCTVRDINFTLLEGATIEGRVVGPDDQPVEDAWIEAWDTDYDHQSEAYTDAEGKFRLTGLGEGEVHLAVSSDDFADYRGTQTAPATGVEIKLRPGAKIVGRVVDKQTREPVQDLELAYFSDEGGSYGATIEADEEGRFERSGLEPGAYTLMVGAEDYAPACVEDIKIEEGVEHGEVLFELVAGAAVVVRVTGVPDGRPVEGASVVRQDEGYDDRISYLSSRWTESDIADTDSNGLTTIEHQLPGSYRYLVTHESFADKTVSFELRQDEPRKEVAVLLDMGITLRGRVITKGDRLPVEGATVHLSKGSRRRWYSFDEEESAPRTDAAGAFTIERVAPGSYWLMIVHPNYAPWDKDLELAQGLAGELLVELGAGGRIVGTVTTARGLPLSDATIRVMGAGGYRPIRASDDDIITDARGCYEVAGLAPAIYRVTVDTEGLEEEGSSDRAMEIKRVVVHDNETVRADFVLGGGAAVFGVVTHGGLPAAEVEIHVSPKGARYLMTAGTTGATLTGEDGAYRLEDLKPGAYELTAMSEGEFGGGSGRGYGHVTRDFEVGAQDVQMNIELGSSGIVSGHVLDATGQPVAEASVFLVQDETPKDPWASLGSLYGSFSSTGETDADGAFELTDVVPGAYRFYVEKDGYTARPTTLTKEAERDVTGMQVRLDKESVVVASAKTDDGEAVDGALFAIADERGRLFTTAWERPDPKTGAIRIGGLAAGRFTIIAYAPGYAPVRREVSVGAEAEVSAQFEFRKGHALAVTVVDGASTPVLGASVMLDTGADPLIGAILNYMIVLRGSDEGIAATDDKGFLTLPNMAEGDYTVHVRCPGYEDADAKVHVGAADARVSVTLKPGNVQKQ